MTALFALAREARSLGSFRFFFFEEMLHIKKRWW
jgi:hypothetical protein